MTPLESQAETPSPGCACNDAVPVLTRYSQQVFLERLRETMLRTNGYGGALDAAWEKTQRQNVSASGNGKHTPEVAESNGGPVAHHIAELVRRVRNAGIDSIVLEASHAYTHQSMDDTHFVRSMELQYREASVVARLLAEENIRVRRVLFIDDYNPNPQTGKREYNLDVDAYLAMAGENGFAPDHLLWEADMAPIAKTMIAYMREHQSLVVEKDRSDLHLVRRAVELSSSGNKVSCAALDAAFSLLKYRFLGDGIVNVLPKRQNGDEFSYRGQQRKVRQILMEHLRIRVMPFFNVFTSDANPALHSSGAHNAFRKRTR